MSRSIFTLLFLVSNICFACDGGDIQSNLSKILHKDSDFREFTCGAKTDCSVSEMQNRMSFTSIRDQDSELELCLAETSANVKNRYTGIFSLDKKNYRFQMVLFDTDIRLFRRNGKIVLVVRLVTDDSTGEGESDTYEWNGENFRHVAANHIPPHKM